MSARALFVGFVVFASVCTLCGSATAQQTTWGIESDFNPRYVWHGLACSEGAVTQNSLWATAHETTYSVWTNTNLDRADGRQTNEIDYSVSWEREWRGASVEPMLQIYTYPNQVDAPSTAEADLKLSWPVGPLTAFTAHGLDVHEYSGAYFGELGVSYERELGKRAQLESSVSLGWASAKFNEVYVGPAKSALNLAAFDLSLTWYTRGGGYIRPHLAITRILNKELRDSVEDPSLVNFGMAVGMEF